MGYKVKKIYQGSNLVRPKWKPGANTLLYLPLESDIKDYSGNNRDVSTNSGMTQSTVGGKACYVVGNTGGINLGTGAASWIKSANQYTFLLWIYVSNTSSPNRCYMEWNVYNSLRLYLGREYNTKKPRFLNTINMYDSMTVMDNSAGDNQWSLICFTLDNGTSNFYINGVKDSHYPKTGLDNSGFGKSGLTSKQWIGLFNTRDGLSSSSAANCAVSSCIMESVARTAQEIADYYNQTKSNYGIS